MPGSEGAVCPAQEEHQRGGLPGEAGLVMVGGQAVSAPKRPPEIVLPMRRRGPAPGSDLLQPQIPREIRKQGLTLTRELPERVELADGPDRRTDQNI